jgi:hypothetical protein
MPTISESSARNLRTAERFLVAPPIEARFGTTDVAINDLSARGARFVHEVPIESGAKATLRLIAGDRELRLEALVIWTQHDRNTSAFVSGVRTYGGEEAIASVLAELQRSGRTSRIEELRSADRFILSPFLTGELGSRSVDICDLSAHGARVESDSEIPPGSADILRFDLPATSFTVAIQTAGVWSHVRSIGGADRSRHAAGLSISENPEVMRLAIGRLCELNRASLDTRSLALKLKILRARARHQAAGFSHPEPAGIPAEQFLLIQGVREELRVNPEEAIFWYRKARFDIGDPVTRMMAPPIADHPDALAVWEYLDRSIDPTVIGRSFLLK